MVHHLPKSVSCQSVKKGENLFSDTLSFFYCHAHLTDSAWKAAWVKSILVQRPRGFLLASKVELFTSRKLSQVDAMSCSY